MPKLAMVKLVKYRRNLHAKPTQPNLQIYLWWCIKLCLW